MGEGLDPPAPMSTRRRIIEEIIATERTFVCNLKTVLDVYIEPLRNRSLLTKDEIASLFSNWEYLYPLNKTFLEDLEATFTAAAEHGGGEPSIGPAFKTFAPYFRMFSAYLAGYYRAVDLMEELEVRNRKFALFLEESHKDARCNNLDLLSFLIMPVQRIPRYKLLLEALVHNTPSNHHDLVELQEALILVSAVAAHNNEHIRKQQSQLKIVEIQRVLEPNGPIHVNLLETPTRRFLREGALNVRRSRDGYIKRLHVWLFNDLIILGRPDMFHPDKYIIKAVWDVGEVILGRGASEGDQVVVSSPGNTLAGLGITEDADKALVLTRTTADPRSPAVVAGDMWVLWAKDGTELEAWASDLGTAIEERTRIVTRGGSGSYSSSLSQTGPLRSSFETALPPAVPVETETSWLASSMMYFRSSKGVHPKDRDSHGHSLSTTPPSLALPADNETEMAESGSVSIKSPRLPFHQPRTASSPNGARVKRTHSPKPLKESLSSMELSEKVLSLPEGSMNSPPPTISGSEISNSGFGGFFTEMPAKSKKKSVLGSTAGKRPLSHQIKNVLKAADPSIKAKLALLRRMRAVGPVKDVVLGSENGRSKRFNEAADAILEVAIIVSSAATVHEGGQEDEAMIAALEAHVARENLALDCLLELLVLVAGQKIGDQRFSRDLPEFRSILQSLAAARAGPALTSPITPHHHSVAAVKGFSRSQQQTPGIPSTTSSAATKASSGPISTRTSALSSSATSRPKTASGIGNDPCFTVSQISLFSPSTAVKTTSAPSRKPVARPKSARISSSSSMLRQQQQQQQHPTAATPSPRKRVTPRPPRPASERIGGGSGGTSNSKAGAQVQITTVSAAVPKQQTAVRRSSNTSPSTFLSQLASGFLASKAPSSSVTKAASTGGEGRADRSGTSGTGGGIKQVPSSPSKIATKQQK